ncbi:metal ABC transporter permease [Desulfurispira natronophila]|uniref:Zinc transport system permease protein n=1 Tax=Desulfurispira natronophila TaxID=682562 RepID=A0A7W8DFZ1_9BACT|nr:metal ABC transporter permease [Desulfurispira natronophila]MBB5020882.1 zinc transport system permease protein [Desulfurispira natronophila]
MIEAFFQYSFIQRAVLAGVMVGFIAPLIGVYLVMRRLSLIADALSHVTLAGIAAGMLWNKVFPALLLSPVITGMGASVIGALCIEKLRKVYRHYQELSIPIILAAGVGLGVVLISMADGFNADLFGYLFGSVVAVSPLDLKLITSTSLLVIAIIAVTYRPMFYLAFDEEGARIAGIPHRLLNTIFIFLVALVIAVGMRVVGVLLISSMITLPVAASLQIARSFWQTIIYSIVFAQLAIITGLVLSFYLDWASGGTIVLVAVALLLLCMGYRHLTRRE